MTDFDSAIEYADKAIEKAKLYSDYSFEDILLLKQNKLSSLTNNYDFEAAMPLVAEIELAIKNNELPRDSYFYAYAQLSSTYGQFGMLEQSYNFFQLAESYSDQIPVNTKIYFLLDMSSDAPNNFVRKSCIDRRGISIKLCKQRMITCWCIYIVFMAITILAFGITRKPWNPM